MEVAMNAVDFAMGGMGVKSLFVLGSTGGCLSRGISRLAG